MDGLIVFLGFVGFPALLIYGWWKFMRGMQRKRFDYWKQDNENRNRK